MAMVVALVSRVLTSEYGTDGRQIGPKSKLPAIVDDGGNVVRGKDSKGADGWVTAIRLLVEFRSPVDGSLDLPLWTANLVSMGEKPSRAVAFSFVTDGISLGGLGTPRVDSPIAAAMMEFMPWSIDGDNSVGPLGNII